LWAKGSDGASMVSGGSLQRSGVLHGCGTGRGENARGWRRSVAGLSGVRGTLGEQIGCDGAAADRNAVRRRGAPTPFLSISIYAWSDGSLFMVASFAVAVLLGGLGSALALGADMAFTDITLEAGTGGPTGPGRTGGHGVFFADVDGDGLPDLYVTMIFDDPMPDRFYRNLGQGRFREEGVQRGIDDFDGGSHGAVFADLNNDGHLDLFNGATWHRPQHPAINRIYQNDGKGFFTDRTGASGIPSDRTWPTRAVLALDMDGSGLLDLFCVTGYLGSADPPDERNEAYQNLGDLQFAPFVPGDLTLAPCGQGATDTDFDGDGHIDIIAANRTGQVNILRNDGRGRFSRIDPVSIGIRHQAGDGITMADVTNDGQLDMLLASAGEAHLYLNNGDGTFTWSQSFSDTRGYMGGFADLDHNGFVDLVFAGDHKVYLNDGTGRFAPGPSVPVDGINDPRAIAFADIDDDGDLDFAIGCKRSRNWLVRNDLTRGGNWLKVRLVSPQGQAGAFGARVWIHPAGQANRSGTPLLGMREARSNTGYLAQDDPVLHFGLGQHRAVDITVRFRDGTVHTRTHVAAHQTIQLDGRTGASLDQTGVLWETLEWSLDNPGISENPFDLEAWVLFEHEQTGETRRTGMFYDGGAQWRFRFTPTRSGAWRFSTRSEAAALDGWRGAIIVRGLSSDGASGERGMRRGFLTTVDGNKWAWQTGEAGEVAAFVPQLVMARSLTAYHEQPDKIHRDVQTWMVDHGFTGMHLGSVACRWFDLASMRHDQVPSANPNPDLRTFQILEQLIRTAHAAGGMIHIWKWGDEDRRLTPLRWGINGEADCRLQRYIAARLGPMPGWSLGYGFDLWEWVTADQLESWHEYLHQHAGWKPIIGGRAHQHGTPLARLMTDKLDYLGYETHKPDYAVYVESLSARPDKPAFQEDRFRVRIGSPWPDKDYDLVQTRRGLWHSTLAGGVANIWGNLVPDSDEEGSLPYPNKDQIKTWSRFFEHRFLAGMTRHNELTDGVALIQPERPLVVVYREDADRIRINLTGLPTALKAVAVDTTKAYAEIDLGELTPREHIWQAPYASDWAVAIGEPGL
jgi:hypothetical protein